jgi:hypothetical protein
MNEKRVRLSPDCAHFDFAGIVRNVEQQTQIAIGKEVRKYAPRVVTEDSRFASAQLIAARMAPR